MSETGLKGNLFGLPNKKNSSLEIIPVKWEVTTSYGDGTSNGPEAILNASSQLDLYHPVYGEFYNKGIAMGDFCSELESLHNSIKTQAKALVLKLENGQELTKNDHSILNNINSICEKMNTWVYEKSSELLSKGKKAGLVGGDHSSPLGLIKAISEEYNSYSILHLDAHCDLRNSYQGFKYSHASIMHNVLKLKKPPKKLVQVGIRDVCQEEINFADQNNIKIFSDYDIQNSYLSGTAWSQIVSNIISELSNNVYISFDIDGLQPNLCPGTGTPVPGGLSFNQAIFLLNQILKSNKNIIGFDLCEVAPQKNTEWNENVGARILFHLCGVSLYEK